MTANDQHGNLFESLDRIRRSEYRCCLVEENCTEEAVNAHSVPRTVLRTISEEGYVIAPDTYTSADGLELRFRPEGIGQASIGNFSCQMHDSVFRAIDTTDIDFEDPRICDLIWFRALLREAWLLLRVRPFSEKLDNLSDPSLRMENRLQSLLDCIRWLRPSLMSSTMESPANHIVRRVKSEHPILATSYAAGGSTVAYDTQTGRPIPIERLRTLLRREPRECWGFTVIPREKEHVIVASWLNESSASHYFQHFKEVAGKELEAAVSAQLIGFCENWFLSPRVWGSYHDPKKDAIVSAYTNIERLFAGRYKWVQRGKRTWYEFMDIPNRHQINLFKYDPSVFEHATNG